MGDYADENPRNNEPESPIAPLLKALSAERRKERAGRWIRFLCWMLVITGIAVFFAMRSDSRDRVLFPERKAMVGVVNIHGEISDSSQASADQVIPALQRAFEDKSVKVVALAINSGGGSPVEAERINYAIQTLRKAHPKPVIAVVQSLGASAAYMIAMHADSVYSSRTSLVGSIGAVMQTWDFHKALNKVDVQQNVYASGKLKSFGNPFVAPTPDMESKARALVKASGDEFYEAMKKARTGKLNAAFAYNTGEVWIGTEALKLGLVDEIGTLEQVADIHSANIRDFGPEKSRGLLSKLLASEVSEWLSRSMAGAVRQLAEDTALIR